MKYTDFQKREIKKSVAGIIAAVIILLSMVICSPVQAQTTYSVQGTTYVAQKASKSSATQTQYTYQDTKGNTYPIWLSKNGHAFVKRTSQKTGKEYNQYLSEEISRDICQKVGVEYVPSQKRK